MVGKKLPSIRVFRRKGKSIYNFLNLEFDIQWNYPSKIEVYLSQETRKMPNKQYTLKTKEARKRRKNENQS